MGAEHLHILSLNYQNAALEDVGLLHVTLQEQPKLLAAWKEQLELQGIVFLSTCNRVEFILSDDKPLDAEHLEGHLMRSLGETWLQGHMAIGIVHFLLDEGVALNLD